MLITIQLTPPEPDNPKLHILQLVEINLLKMLDSFRLHSRYRYNKQDLP